MSFYLVFNEFSQLPRVNETSISIEFVVVLMDVDLNTLECFLVSQG